MSVAKNYFYNLIYQVLTMILPLITVPYVSRVLKPEGVGTFAYTYSIVHYFTLIGMLGIGTYGNKMVAMTRDNKELLSRTFLSIYSLQLILSLISAVGYLILVLTFFHEDRIVAIIQIMNLLSVLVDISWFFNGLEQFKKIVSRNIFVKMISLAAIFMFVKNQEDLALYTFILGISAVVGQGIMWIYLKESIVHVSIDFHSIIQHLKPTLVYFLPQVAAQIYFVLNKTMIGLLSSKSEVGIYDYADKILKLSLAMVTSLGTVMLPRMANTFANGDFSKARDYIMKSLDFSTLIAVPIMFGLAGIANDFIPWYLGKGFLESINVLIILSPTILFMSWTGVFGTQYLVPLGKMKEYTLSLYIGAIVNLIINLILIKPYGSIGAAIGTLCTEFAVLLAQLLFVRKEIGILKGVSKTVYYLISGSTMLIIVKIIGYLLGASIMTTLVQAMVGSVAYILIVLFFEFLGRDGLIISQLKERRTRKVNELVSKEIIAAEDK